MKSNRLEELTQNYEALINRKNEICNNSNGIYKRYYHPVLTAEHAPLIWKYDFDEKQNPFMEERIGINAVMNTGAIKINHKYYLVARVEGADRKSFFAVAESNSPVDGFRFWDYPIEMPETDIPDTNMYDMRLTAHEDGWIYGIFCAERKDTNAPAGDLSSAVAVAGIARTKDLKTWQRLPDLKSPSQQRNVVLHPEFVNGKYALYTRPQDGFIDAGNGGGIGWALIDDICHAEIKEEKIINKRFYHTIKEVKNGEGPHPIKTPQGWLHLAHGVRGCAAGLRYVLYLYMTSLEDPTEIIAEPAGYFTPATARPLGSFFPETRDVPCQCFGGGTGYTRYAGTLLAALAKAPRKQCSSIPLCSSGVYGEAFGGFPHLFITDGSGSDSLKRINPAVTHTIGKIVLF